MYNVAATLFNLIKTLKSQYNWPKCWPKTCKHDLLQFSFHTAIFQTDRRDLNIGSNNGNLGVRVVENHLSKDF